MEHVLQKLQKWRKVAPGDGTYTYMINMVTIGNPMVCRLNLDH